MSIMIYLKHIWSWAGYDFMCTALHSLGRKQLHICVIRTNDEWLAEQNVRKLVEMTHSWSGQVAFAYPYEEEWGKMLHVCVRGSKRLPTVYMYKNELSPPPSKQEWADAKGNERYACHFFWMALPWDGLKLWEDSLLLLSLPNNTLWKTFCSLFLMPLCSCWHDHHPAHPSLRLGICIFHSCSSQHVCANYLGSLRHLFSFLLCYVCATFSLFISSAGPWGLEISPKCRLIRPTQRLCRARRTAAVILRHLGCSVEWSKKQSFFWLLLQAGRTA